MPVTIDEVTADVTPQDGRGAAVETPAPPLSSPSEQRRQRELFERMQQRAARVCAN